MLFDSFITAQLSYWDNCCYACLEFNLSNLFLSPGAAKFCARLKLMYPVIFRRACLRQLSMKKTIELESPPAELSQYEKIVELLTTLFPVWVCCTKVYEGFVFF